MSDDKTPMASSTEAPPDDLAEQIIAWSRRTFPEQTLERLARHLVEEAGELETLLDAVEPIGEEVADCGILIIAFLDHLERLTAARDIDPNAEMWAKHQRNLQRQWATDPVLGYDKRVEGER